MVGHASTLADVHVSSAVKTAIWRNVHVIWWVGEVNVADLDILEAMGVEMGRRFPGGFGTINVVHTQFSLPDGPTRRRAGKALRESHIGLRCSCNVLPGEGFWMSAARMALMAIYGVSGSEQPKAVFVDAEDAADFTAEKLGEPVTFANDLRHALRELQMIPAAAATG